MVNLAHVPEKNGSIFLEVYYSNCSQDKGKEKEVSLLFDCVFCFEYCLLLI